MKKMMIALMALAVIGGGAGAYFFFGAPAQAATTEEPKEEEETASKEEGKEGEAAKPASFVKMEPLILPIVDGNGVSQIVNLVVALEVKDEPTAKEVEAVQPRLKDAYIQDMYGVLTKQAAMQGGVIQVGYIKSRLNKVTTKVLGENKVKDVLLQVVQQRPI